jgi:uncharacterized protein YecE (DUF72 family)
MHQDKFGPQLDLFPDDVPNAHPTGVGPTTPPAPLATLANRLPPSVRLGTSSWSFPGWQGIVYDRLASEETLAREGLTAYAAHPLLRTVSVDRSFYRPLSADQFRAYADAVPSDFRFVVKADRLVTSPADPDARSVRTPNARFLDPSYAAEQVVAPTLEGLGPRAGPLVFQFPPIPPKLVGGRNAFLERLHGFLTALPRPCLYAVELRTPAFLTESYARILEETGVAHCYNVHPASAPLARQLELIHPFQQPALVGCSDVVSSTSPPKSATSRSTDSWTRTCPPEISLLGPCSTRRSPSATRSSSRTTKRRGRRRSHCFDSPSGS